MESGLRVYHQESFTPPQRIASVWQCTDHRRTGNSLCWDEQADHLYICWTTEGQGRCLVEGHSSVCAICCVCRRGPHKSVCLITCSGSVLCYLKEFPGEDSVVHCVIGCGEVDKGSSSDYTFLIPIFNELREVQEFTSAGLKCGIAER